MEIKIENILILSDEKVTDIFVSLINTLSLSSAKRKPNGETFRNENFGRPPPTAAERVIAWVAQRMITDPK